MSYLFSTAKNKQNKISCNFYKNNAKNTKNILQKRKRVHISSLFRYVYEYKV